MFNLKNIANNLFVLVEPAVIKILGALLILVIGWWLSSLITKFIVKTMIKAKLDPAMVSFFRSIIKVFLRLIVIISVVAQLGVNVSSIIAAIGAAGLAIGLALKDSLSNIASGALIIINKPFSLNDYLEVDNIKGNVKKIEIMYTTLVTTDNKNVIIPNSKLASANIINYTAQRLRRLDLNYSISYNSDIIQAKKILQNIVDSDNRILKSPKPIIGVGEHKDSCINIVVQVWCNTDDYFNIYYDMQENVKLTFDANGIEIPFNKLDVYIKEQNANSYKL